MATHVSSNVVTLFAWADNYEAAAAAYQVAKAKAIADYAATSLELARADANHVEALKKGRFCPKHVRENAATRLSTAYKADIEARKAVAQYP